MPARDPRYDILFEPVRIGPKTLRNRFFQVPHCCGFGTVKPGTQAGHRGTKAEGGWAAVCTEYCSISPQADVAGFVCAQLFDDHDVRNLRLMTDEAHEHGALAGVQLWHGGSVSNGWESRLPALSSSDMASQELGGWVVPKPMEAADIRQVQREHVEASLRARDAGFDIVYVYPGHGYLLMQFLSPFHNKRTDEYGGSLENRARFFLETTEMMREAVGDDLAIAARIGLQAMGNESGLPEEELYGVVELADHLVDLWDVAVDHWPDDSSTSRNQPTDHEGPFFPDIKRHTSKPVVGVGRLTSPDTMAAIIRSGRWDLIGAARPSISDPYLPRKIEEGRVEDVRECIGCNICIARGEWGRQLICTQNPTAGEEYRRGWHPERFTQAANAAKSVLIVGGGPAGLECATVLGKRGMHAVHLVDASREIGGSVAQAARLPGLSEWRRLIDWRLVQIEKLRNVALIPGKRLDAGAIRDYGADIVILATGSHWRPDGVNGVTHAPIPGADAALPHVLTPEQVLAGEKPAGTRVVVYDTDGYYMGVGMAELLARRGHEVVLVTPDSDISSFSEYTLELERVSERIYGLGIDVRTQTTVEAVAAGGVTAAHAYRPGEVAIEADSVVLVTQRVADAGLWVELDGDRDGLAAEGIEALYRIGDCVTPRIHAEAVFDGHRLAREIDAENPAVALTYVRERPEAEAAA